MIEIWKDIKGYEGLYQVSNLGRVKRIESIVTYSNGRKHLHKEGILKPKTLPSGYVQLQVCKNGVIQHLLLHRIVAIAFIPNPKNKPEVNHKSGNKQDNRVSELEWLTRSENAKHSFKVLGRMAPKPTLGKKGKLHHNSKPIICIDTNEYFECVSMAAEQLRLHHGNISKVLTGKYKSTGGFKFKYAV